MHGSRDSSSTPTVALGPKGTGHDVPESPDLGIPRGSRIGRFIVLRTLGVGGMGVVLAAYDTELDRTVALKLLRPDIAPTEGATQARARLVREAQAMARLRHPNVVTVYEVGEFEEKVFLAMEYVPGPTLLEWGQDRRNEPGGWAKIVAAFVQAGRGLAAAHAHDMVHRDFKPSNVLVDRDRVLLTDFGIASITSPSPDTGPTEAGAAALDDATTRGASAAIGTTPYMAPELFRDGSADAQSDQFAFCVGLFELLYGRRPFEGHDRESWSRSITQGRIVEPEPGDVPDWVKSAVLRGLQGDPKLRWPSIAELVDALDAPDAAGLGRGARIGIAIVTAATFMLLPIFARATVLDRGSYFGVIAQTVGVIAVLAALGWLRRDVTFATPTNRRSFLGALTVLMLQLPLELVNAALGVDPVASDIQHLLYWAAMAALFAVIADRRFIALSASYLAFVPLALFVPEHVVMVLACSNAALVVFLAIIWRERAPPPRGLA